MKHQVVIEPSQFSSNATNYILQPRFNRSENCLIIYILIIPLLLQMWKLLWLGTAGTDALKLVTECKYDFFYHWDLNRKYTYKTF